MANGSRRIVITTLIGTLVGLGVLVVLLGRRRRDRVETRSAASAAVAGVTHAPEVRRVPWGRLAVAAAGLLLVAGLAAIIVQNDNAKLVSQPYNAPSDRTASIGRPFEGPGHESSSARHLDRLSRSPSTGDLDRPFDSSPRDIADPISPGIDTRRIGLYRTTTVIGQSASRAILDLRIENRLAAAFQTNLEGRSIPTQTFLLGNDDQMTLHDIDIAGNIDVSTSGAVVPSARAIDSRPILRPGSPDISTALPLQPDRHVLLDPDLVPPNGDLVRGRAQIGAGKLQDQVEASFRPPNTTHDLKVGRSAVWGESLGSDIHTEHSGPSESVGQTEQIIRQAQQDQPTSTGSLSAAPYIRAPRPTQATDGMRDEAVLVRPGDSLWKTSLRLYGSGKRYNVIFDANRDQIADPNLIHPGQLLIVPPRQSALRRDRIGTH